MESLNKIQKREIKFRGYAINYWEYGSYIKIIENNKIFDIIFHEDDSYTYVDSESIGQFTGLYDKNGKEIYEGDIVSYNRIIQNYDDDDILNPRYYKTPQYETKSFKSEVKYMYNSFTIMDNSKWNDLQVIGNIYENPELLKSEGEK